VVKEGEVPKTTTPDPVSSVIAEARLADEGVARKVATLAPNPDTPVEMGRPVQLVRVPEVGVPRRGVTNVGEVANTREPVPVSFVTAEIRLAEDGVARNVAMPAARPDTPVEIGRPVQLVNVPDVGVPSIGVTRVGEVANTLAPEPVSSVRADARLAEEGVARKVATPVPRPVMLPTAGVTVFVVTAVTCPLALTVTEGATVAEPNVPTLALTVSMVITVPVPDTVISP
jgi:hypothetical protein